MVGTPIKTEGDAAPSPAATPAAPYSVPQWASAHVPIDPALQQQQPAQATTPYGHYAYGSHYPQAAYPGYHQAYAAQATAAQSQSQPQGQAAAGARQSSQSTNIDSSDLATLNDALGSAGVDLRAEEETLQRSYEQHRTYSSFEDRTRKQPPKPNFDTRFLGTTLRAIGTKHKITNIPDDSVNYMAFALRTRLQELITGMIAAAHHRTDTQFERPASLYENDTPMWSIVVRSDVAKQLAALEKVEREEEMKVRRERKERLEAAAAHAAALAAQLSGAPGAMQTDSFDDTEPAGGPKKKRKKEGPGVTARNMSEDVRKKMSNAVATQAAGLGKYAWMNAANAPSPSAAPKPKMATASTPAAATPTAASAGSAATAAGSSAAGAAATSSWARPYVPTKKPATPAQVVEEDTRTAITLRDAMFVIEKERGHGGGRGAANVCV